MTENKDQEDQVQEQHNDEDCLLCRLGMTLGGQLCINIRDPEKRRECEEISEKFKRGEIGPGKLDYEIFKVVGKEGLREMFEKRIEKVNDNFQKESQKHPSRSRSRSGQ